MDRAGLRRKLLKAQAEAGDIVLLFGDESEALTHPYLAHAWAKKGADLRIPAPGQAAKVAMLGVLDWALRDLKRHHLAHQTFTGPDDLDCAIHKAVLKLNTERNRHPWDNQQMAA